ncbi:MAG: hypothetical protein WDN47_02890 [Candidatus Doudnabacteria bacterium]
MTAFIVFALGWLVICQAVKFYRQKPTLLPLRSLDTKQEQSVYAAMKSICGK